MRVQTKQVKATKAGARKQAQTFIIGLAVSGVKPAEVGQVCVTAEVLVFNFQFWQFRRYWGHQTARPLRGLGWDFGNLFLWPSADVPQPATPPPWHSC